MANSSTNTNLSRQIKAMYARQYENWDLARKNIDSLKNIEIRTFRFEPQDIEVKIQFNPARIVSSAAKIDAQSISERPCLLCASNRPDVQEHVLYKDVFEILLNPFPILPFHFTIASIEHVPQTISSNYAYMLDLAYDLPDFTILYNGAKAGASAPDHMHFQAVERGHLPVEYEYEKLPQTKGTVLFADENGVCRSMAHYLRSCIVIESTERKTTNAFFGRVYQQLQSEEGCEPMMNVFCRYKNDSWITFIFPRSKHRPTQYFAEGEDKLLISPGAIDMAGMLIVPLKKDFEKMTKSIIQDVYRQVSKPVDELTVSVGILQSDEVIFELKGLFVGSNGKRYTSLQKAVLFNGKLSIDAELMDEITFSPSNGNCYFGLKDVTIGIDFHWERKEDQRFVGSLKLIVKDGEIVAINILPVEEYLSSVISSEMSASASLQLLKAHAVISRSWLLANMKEYAPCQSDSGISERVTEINNATEHIKWYERDAHSNFDVCADDHCQRYQGITRINGHTALQAVEETKGEVLMVGAEICDARFSKSCGGMTEKFENCWADIRHSYLTTVVDSDDVTLGENFELDLTIEKNAEKWILHSPVAFCNTIDKKILSQILNNYDQETVDFYRWEVVYSQKEISSLLQLRSGIDFGDILDLIPIQRGDSGRLVKMKIVGSKRSIVVGKELEIRKWLSATHLYSSAFVIEKGIEMDGVPQRFILKGAGWGHGVGLCQIGAAVMAEKGYDYKAILAHYYKGSELKKLYF